MLGITNRACRLLADILSGETGLGVVLDGQDSAEDAGLEVKMCNVNTDLAERGVIRYPVAYLYVERLVNNLAERFRTFSGVVRLVVEVRVSRERVERIEEELLHQVEKVLRVLNLHRGDWGYGVFFGGRYEVSFSAVKPGGKGFIQAARIGIDVNMSVE
ncbi:MAG: hypothetical protein NZV14_07985 [Bryobacteraceae bacterium]|nr:hypothetical protein [Bryobacteraceae bacterium]MDW8378086.1 hypothetical protein [Bryobacterales bacterium]